MIRYRPEGFIYPKAEAFAVNTYKYMQTRYSWFATGRSLGEMPSMREYKEEVANLAAHAYVDRGDPEQDTYDACFAVTRWHTMSLRANLNGMLTTSKTVHWPALTGEDQTWRLGWQATAFDPQTEYRATFDEPGYDAVEAADELRRIVKQVMPRLSPSRQRSFTAWLIAGGDRGAVQVAARELGVSRAWVAEGVATAKKEIEKIGNKGDAVRRYP